MAPPFARLIRFVSSEDDAVFLADLGTDAAGLPPPGTKVDAYASLGDLASGTGKRIATVRRLLAPVPDPSIPIYCVGLNYKSHAEEASLPVPAHPPLWTKPAAALAHPDEDVPINAYCAKNAVDYEGELVFVTSKECKDVSPEDAKDYILGYTLGNDLSCRLFQLPQNSGGQFFYAKAFDKFAPIGPSLVSPELFESSPSLEITTKVNGQVRQRADIKTDMIFSPETILSHMSQGTTIPAGTAVMTGTPAGVGIFMNPRSILCDGDVVEVEMGGIGILRNKLRF